VLTLSAAVFRVLLIAPDFFVFVFFLFH